MFLSGPWLTSGRTSQAHSRETLQQMLPPMTPNSGVLPAVPTNAPSLAQHSPGRKRPWQAALKQDVTVCGWRTCVTSPLRWQEAVSP